MLKEIHEQPKALRQCLRGRVEEGSETISLDGAPSTHAQTAVHLVACATSYHAALYGAALLRERNIHAQAFLASEYATAPPPLSEGTLVIGVTQSGETADTLSALRTARDRGDVRTCAVTNVVGSTAPRECDDVVYIRAGPEIGVAATKTFSSQVLALNLLALELSPHSRPTANLSPGLLRDLRDLPQQVQSILDTSNAAHVADHLHDSEAYFFIGRDYHYPVALEGALKLKEITYEHAEGFASGELKHGPLALVTDQTPVFATVTSDGARAQKTIGNIKEVEARGAPVVAITDGQAGASQYADHVLDIPETHPRLTPILANVPLQLVAYHAANKLGRNIDKPRNLAKSVTVE
jgi:glucosamine--fructose-6-phosphate aminotransferase (isomerizing)